MSTITNTSPQTSQLRTASPWGAVAPRAQVGNAEYKLVPDSFQASPVAAPAATTPDAGTPVRHLENMGLQTAAYAAGAASGMPMMVVLLGSHSSTKENQARTLAENLGLVHINMGDLIKEEVASGSDLGVQLQQALNDGEKSPAVLLYDLVARRVRCEDVQEKGFILDAYHEDFKGHQAENLLSELEGLRLISLSGAESCPNCIPVIEAAREKGSFFEVDDEADQQDTADVLEALVDNFQAAPLRLVAI